VTQYLTPARPRVRKLSRGSLQILRRRVPSAQRPRARWRALVRLVAREQGWTNADAFLTERYRGREKFERLAMLPSPFMVAVQRAG
jgi:hypothetical protein